MWHDLWTKHQKAFLFAVGMICFLAAGLIVAGFPSPAKTRKTYARTGKSVPKTELGTVGKSAPEPDIERKIVASAADALSASAPSADMPESEWVIYITGAVRRPGVYRLPSESRLLQLVEAAGGLNLSADPVAVNLAAVLEDGLHVHVPEKGEEPSQQYGGTVSSAQISATRGAVAPISAVPATGTLVDINRASADELKTLKGIGTVIAGNIVDYRLKNGRFHSVEDLLHVRGIGRKKLEGFRDSVTVAP